MHHDLSSSRVLALDLRPQRYGFAMLEGTSRLLDWGTSTYSRSKHGPSFRSLRSIFTVFRPERVVVGDSADWTSVRRSRTTPAIRAIRNEVNWRSLPIEQVSRTEIRNAFSKHGISNKRGISSAIVLLFPELVWRLPRARRPWEAERHSQPVFDAIALGITSLVKLGNSIREMPRDLRAP